MSLNYAEEICYLRILLQVCKCRNKSRTIANGYLPSGSGTPDVMWSEVVREPETISVT